MKKALSLFLSIVIALTSLVWCNITALADGTTGGVNWSLSSDGTLTLTKNGTGRTDSFGQYTNRAPWYNSRTSIKKVVAEYGVIELGSYAFYGCSNITKVFLADTVDTLGTNCFCNCTSLTGVKLPSGCSWYYDGVFYGCTALKWVVLPNSNETNSYSGKIPNNTFRGCTSLEQVYVGSGHTGMGNYAFYNCKNLTTVVWDSGSITSTGTSALTNVPSSCTFMDNATTLSSWCSSNSKTFSQGLTGTCSSNTYSSSKLSYSYDTTNRNLNFSGSGDMNDYSGWASIKYLIGSTNFSSTDGKYSICANAFKECFTLDTAIFGGTQLTTIGSSAYQDCERSTYWLDIPESTTSIGANAFNGTNFNYIKIYSNDITCGTDAFGCTGYARFFTNRNDSFYDWIKANRTNNGYNWYHYCLDDNHDRQGYTVEPTCTEQGYYLYSCAYCDAEQLKSDFTAPLGHSFQYQSKNTTNGTIIGRCSRCGTSNLVIDAASALSDIINGDLSHEEENAENNQPYKQTNYSPYADVYRDGYVNAKDFSEITSLINSVSVTNKLTTVNESTKYQTIEGFGASGAWWAQDIGRWNDEQIDYVTELLYGETGAGLDIYRYNLAGGSQDDTHISDWRRRGECFATSSTNYSNASTYNWNADLAAQRVLASVKRANSDFKLTLFCNTPPVYLTANGFGYCSNGATSNINSSNYQNFANFVATCAVHFIDEGYNVTSVSPINEPEWSWECDSSGNAGQEGCHYEPATARNFYNSYMIPALKGNSKLNGKVGLEIWESGQIKHSSWWDNFLNEHFSSSSSYSSNNANIRSYVDSVATHSYWASTSEKTTVASQLTGSDYSAVKKVRCTEYCQMTGDSNTGVRGITQYEGGSPKGLSIEYGLALADIMYQDLTILNAVEWDWWVACADGSYPDALVYASYNNPNGVETSKRLWCMGNYARFIQDGAQRVSVSTGSSFGKNLTTNTTYTWNDDWGNSGVDKNNYIEQSAYLNPDGSLVIVYINNSDTIEHTSFDNSSYKSYETYVTDETHDLTKYQAGERVNNQVISIPAKSVTTVVIHK